MNASEHASETASERTAESAAPAGAAGPVDAPARLFGGEVSAEYFGGAVTQAGHMLQAGALAEAAGAPAHLVAAALLHDIGHFHGTVTGRDLMEGGQDNRNSHTGADWLARGFGPEVTEPVRLHVAAKRYLCAVEPGYFGLLSEASVHTLRVQGGPMTDRQARVHRDARRVGGAAPFAQQGLARLAAQQPSVVRVRRRDVDGVVGVGEEDSVPGELLGVGDRVRRHGRDQGADRFRVRRTLHDHRGPGQGAQPQHAVDGGARVGP